MTAENSASIQRRRGRAFAPGQSGNPAGKPPGARNRALLILDKLGEKAAAGVLDAVLTAARNGDVAAARVILDRVWPARRGRPVQLDLPGVTTAEGVTAALAAVVQAMAAGSVTPEEGASLSAVIEAQRRAIETADLERRIVALEGGGQ